MLSGESSMKIGLKIIQLSLCVCVCVCVVGGRGYPQHFLNQFFSSQELVSCCAINGIFS